MRIIVTLCKGYLQHWESVLDTCTLTDAWHMLILSLLLLIAGVADLLHLVPF